jgi:hypothetical protein
MRFDIHPDGHPRTIPRWRQPANDPANRRAVDEENAPLSWTTARLVWQEPF